MINVAAYSTGRKDTTELVKLITSGLNHLPHVNIHFIDISDFKSNGLNKCFDCHIFLGILRGTGDLYRECNENGIDFIYIDHAYFRPGYKFGWLRCCRVSGR